MLDINPEINKLLYDYRYQKKALEAFNQGEFFDVYQYLKKNNIDAHKFKKSILGKKAKISRYDIFVDTVDDSLWLGTKLKGSMQWIETFETLSGLGG